MVTVDCKKKKKDIKKAGASFMKDLIMHIPQYIRIYICLNYLWVHVFCQ